MNKVKRFEQVSETATEIARNWTNVEVMKFHYFNPNGLCAEWRRACDRVNKLVDNGDVPNGWILAYGSLSTFEENEITKLAMQKRVNSVSMRVAISMMEKAIARTNEKCAEKEKELAANRPVSDLTDDEVNAVAAEYPNLPEAQVISAAENADQYAENAEDWLHQFGASLDGFEQETDKEIF